MIKPTKQFSPSIYHFFIGPILLLFGYFVFRSSLPPIKLQSPNEIIKPSIFDTTRVILNGVNPDVEIYVHDDIVLLDSNFKLNSIIPLHKYLTILTEVNNTGSIPVLKNIVNQFGHKYLLLRYFSGGAHCCNVFEIYKLDVLDSTYTRTDSFSGDVANTGEIQDFNYPIVYSSSTNYFHSKYMDSKHLNCLLNDYKELIVIKEDTFDIECSGNPKILEDCLINFLNDTYIPELDSNGNDGGERELVFNTLQSLFCLGYDEVMIFNIYNTHMQNVSDKARLWKEIMLWLKSK